MNSSRKPIVSVKVYATFTTFVGLYPVSGLEEGRVHMKDEVMTLRIRPISFAAC